MTAATTVRRSDTIAALSEALAAAQGEMRNPPKDSVNPHFKSKYADLATVRDTVMPVLNRHGLAVLQLPCEVDGGPALTSILLHKSGEWFETTIALRAQQNTPQGIGSALTYCRRYALQSLAGVAADDDDDGNASGRGNARPSQQPDPKAKAMPAKTHEQPASKPDGVDRTADNATRAAAEVKKFGDPMNDSAAIRDLATRKGYTMAAVVESINAKFKTTYTPLKTPWGDIADGHRKEAIAKLAALPDVGTASDLRGLIDRLAGIQKTQPDYVFLKYAQAAELHECITNPEEMTTAQLAQACKSFRAKFAAMDAEPEKGGAA